jgi:hypothetical protein
MKTDQGLVESENSAGEEKTIGFEYKATDEQTIGYRYAAR